jgi:hypothetical protein
MVNMNVTQVPEGLLPLIFIYEFLKKGGVGYFCEPHILLRVVGIRNGDHT